MGQITHSSYKKVCVTDMWVPLDYADIPLALAWVAFDSVARVIKVYQSYGPPPGSTNKQW